MTELREVFDSLLSGGSSMLQYTVSDGLPRLREQVAARMARDGVDCSAADVLMLQGAQQGLDLVARMMLDPGDVVVTENPTFLGALIAFNQYQPAYAAVATDEAGMDPDDLARVLAVNPRAKLIYTVPDFQNPTGVTLSLERRRRVVELANRYDVLVLEDSPYRELRFAGEPVATLKSLDTEGRVVFLGSFSKILAPGLRLGWSVASEDLTARLGLLKLAADTQCSTLNMAAASGYLDRFDIDEHITEIRAAYRRKRDLMLTTIEELFPPTVTHTRPDGGLFTWLTFPEGFDTAAFLRDEAIPRAKVAFVPGATFFPVTQEANHARVNFSGVSDERIVDGMTRLARLLRARLPG
jgi:DNA-binding transcriptional MocR family regulator